MAPEAESGTVHYEINQGSLAMSVGQHRDGAACRCACCEAAGLSRRAFVGALGGAAVAGLAWQALPAAALAAESAPTGGALPPGAPLRVKPLLVYAIPVRQELTSWRPYGGLASREDVEAEARRIDGELKKLAADSEFPIEFAPVSLVGNQAEAEAAAKAETDALLVYASGGPQEWFAALAASGKPNIMFLRHRSGPFYLYYEIALFRFLNKNTDTDIEPNMDAEDIVVDEYGDVLWRLRAHYGLKNAMGTKVIALGGLQAYTPTGQECGPKHAREVWKYEIIEVSHADMEARLARLRSDERAMADAARQADALLAERGVTLETDRRFVVNTFVALRLFKDIMAEHGATNIGVANCMGGLIRPLDTPPCLALSLLNDEGLTGFCHVDLTHTMPGVLLRWISAKPSFVANTHFPHHGMITIAHCAAPRKMNGKDLEPVRIMTHFESDYGAATKVEYTKGQVTTTVVPNFACTRWCGFRGKVLDSPSFPICRSQIDLEIDGQWERLTREMQGFHAVTCYGDYLREVGYALRRLNIAWDNFSS